MLNIDDLEAMAKATVGLVSGIVSNRKKDASSSSKRPNNKERRTSLISNTKSLLTSTTNEPTRSSSSSDSDANDALIAKGSPQKTSAGKNVIRFYLAALRYGYMLL